tara:strand:- start:339 stop:797 length:459 start_codon:yes stop_codon:yes gene_type:complete
MYSKSTIYILIFIITALWDVVLRYMSENYDTLPKYIQSYGFLKALQPYFKHHTILSAALIAGFVGACSLYIILLIHELPTNMDTTFSFMIVVFVVSALYGFLMKFSGLHPHLDKTYYKYLGTVRGMLHDGVSGLIAGGTLLVVLYVLKYYKM